MIKKILFFPLIYFYIPAFCQIEGDYYFTVDIKCRFDNCKDECKENMPLHKTPLFTDYFTQNRIFLIIEPETIPLSLVPDGDNYAYDFKMSHIALKALLNRSSTEFNMFYVVPRMGKLIPYTETCNLNLLLKFDFFNKINSPSKEKPERTSLDKIVPLKQGRWKLECPLVFNPPPAFSLSLFNVIVQNLKNEIEILIKAQDPSKRFKDAIVIEKFGTRLLAITDSIYLKESIGYILKMDTTWIMRDINLIASSLEFFSAQTDSLQTFWSGDSTYSLKLNSLSDTVLLRNLLKKADSSKRYFGILKNLLNRPIVISDSLNSSNYLLVYKSSLPRKPKVNIYGASNFFRLVRVNQPSDKSKSFIEVRNLNLMVNTAIKPFEKSLLSRLHLTFGMGMSTYNTSNSDTSTKVRVAPSVGIGAGFPISRLLFLGIMIGKDFISQSKYYNGLIRQKYWVGLNLGIKIN